MIKNSDCLACMVKPDVYCVHDCGADYCHFCFKKYVTSATDYCGGTKSGYNTVQPPSKEHCFKYRTPEPSIEEYDREILLRSSGF